MKASQFLAEIKQIEGELLRSIAIRDEVIQHELSLKNWETEKRTAKELEKIEKEFLENKKKRFAETTKKIDGLKKRLIDMKAEVNKKNIELGLDKKLLEIKYLRIELSKLMQNITPDRYSMLSRSKKDFEDLGLFDLIKELEQKKLKLDSEVQNVNFRTEIP